jgi:two-component system phosphate regulon sensor histidine kinase PhoR
VFTAMLPAIFAVIAVVLCLAHLIARRLTANIVRPLNDISFEGDNVPTDVYDELLPFVRRIDRQKREIDGQLVALKSRADTIEAITGNMQEGLILIDRSGVVLIFNKSAADIFGGDDMAHRNVRHICREITFQQGLGRCLAGEHAQINFARAGKIYDVFFSPVYGGGAINGAVILFLDITEKHNAEEQRRAFSANVSHELKTPLTTISALSEMMETGMARAEDVRDFAAKIAGQAKRLIDIIDDIIRLSEFDEGKISKEYTVFDLYELAESVMDALQERADAKHVALSVTGAHLQVRANKRMIDELLYNLVDNGIKYNRMKGQVTVTLSEEDGLCKIAVDDTGIGIPAAHQGRVFERFYRVDTSRSKKTGGTGLGLSIVKHIVEHHGGKIEMQSAEGAGTTVVCYIAKQN